MVVFRGAVQCVSAVVSLLHGVDLLQSSCLVPASRRRLPSQQNVNRDIESGTVLLSSVFG